MLRLRLTRVGRNRERQFRLVVAEHSAPVKGKYVEVLGHYHPTATPKSFVADQERINYWISKGAKPSDTAASLLKKHLQMSNMEQYMEPRTRQRKSKQETKEAAAAPAAPATPAA